MRRRVEGRKRSGGDGVGGLSVGGSDQDLVEPQLAALSPSCEAGSSLSRPPKLAPGDASLLF